MDKLELLELKKRKKYFFKGINYFDYVFFIITIWQYNSQKINVVENVFSTLP